MAEIQVAEEITVAVEVVVLLRLERQLLVLMAEMAALEQHLQLQAPL
jgi:hypothetical protein